MARPARQPSPPCAHWPCAWPPTALTMAKKFPPLEQGSSRWHEPLALGQGKAAAGGVASNRTERSLAERFSSSPHAAGWPNYTFAFHDGDEVGPGLIAQIAKKTGLQPEDL